LATQDEPAERVCDRKRIAAVSVAHGELALEVGRPYGVWADIGRKRWQPGVDCLGAPSSGDYEAVSLENEADGAGDRPGDLEGCARKVCEQLTRPPGGMKRSESNDGSFDFI
jgi:hypothetical protein